MMLSCSTGARSFGNLLRNAYGAFETEPTSGLQASGAVQPVDSGALDGFEIIASAVSSRRPALGGPWENSAFILAMIEGEADVAHCGQAIALKCGDLTLLDAQEACRIDVPSNAHALTLSLPRSLVMALRPDRAGLFGVRMSASRTIGKILSRTIRTVVAENCHDPREIRAIREAVLTLIDEALDGVDVAARRQPGEAAIFARMRQFLLKDVGSRTLDAAGLAREFGMSRRSIYRLFAGIGTTPARWMSDLKLQQAYDILMNSEQERRSICDIAYSVGFNDSSHFARSFRQRFGITPKICRPRND